MNITKIKNARKSQTHSGSFSGMEEHQNAPGVKTQKPYSHKHTLLQTAQSFLRVASWHR